LRYWVPLSASAVATTSAAIGDGSGVTSVGGLVRASGGVGAPGKGRGTAPRLAQAAVATAMVTATSTASRDSLAPS
jgi:hypothetical protein